MNQEPSRSPRIAPEIRNGLFFAALMLLIPLGLKFAARSGWADVHHLSERSLMVLIGAFLASIGNMIPKRLAPLAAQGDPARAQSFHRFAGWTWVLTGVALGLSWLVLPLDMARNGTLIIIPAGIALIVLRCVGLRWMRQPVA